MRIEHCSSARSELDWLSHEARAECDELRLLFCHYREPAVIFGLSQRPDAALRQRLDNAGIAWMRRRAGGGTVYAGPWLLGVSVVMPRSHAVSALDPVQAYRWFGEHWQAVLASLGFATHLPDDALISASRERARAQGVDWACYGALGHGELGSDEQPVRKVLGIAQIRTRTASTLVAGLNLAATDWRALCDLLGRPPSRAEPLAAATVGLSDLTAGEADAPPQVLARRVESAFVARLGRAVDGNPEPPL